MGPQCSAYRAPCSCSTCEMPPVRRIISSMPSSALRIAIATCVCLALPASLGRLHGAPADQQAPAPPSDPRPYFTEPAISPDRAEITVSSGGDLWSVPLAGGEARLLVSHA